MRHRTLLGLAFSCALCALLALGCKRNDSYLSVNKGKFATGDGGRQDGSVGGGARDGGSSGKGSGGSDAAMDGGLPFDAAGATMDAAALMLDGSLDLPDGTYILPDGAIYLPDGEIIDLDAAVMRYTPEIDVTACNLANNNDSWSTKVDIGDEGGFSLVPGQTGFGLAFQVPRSTSCGREIDVMHIPATSGFPMPRAVPLDCKYITDVALLGEQDGWRLAWVDNYTNMAELHTLALDLDMNVPAGGARRQLTSNQLMGEQKPVLRDIAGHPVVAWITDDMSSTPDTYRITTQLLDGDAQPIDVLKASDGQTPQSIALSQVGMTAGALAWVGPLTNPGVWLQKLDSGGAPVDAPVQLTDKVAASSSIDLAGRFNGGAAIYSIELDGYPQVRFRRLDQDGALLADEREIVGPPLRAKGASIATLGGGYAVAYRAVSGGDITSPEVRLTFVTKEGNTIRDQNGQLVSFPIGPATDADGRTYVSVSVEGELMVAWIDADPTSGGNLLKVVRRRLDCPQ